LLGGKYGIKCLDQLFTLCGMPNYVHTDLGCWFISQKLNSLGSAWFWGFFKKIRLNARVLRGNFAGLVCSTGPVKVSKDAASLLVCTRKKNFCLGDAGFLWVTSKVEDF